MILFKKLLLHTLKIWPFLYKIQTEPHYKKMEICIGLGSSFTFDITCVTYRETYPQGVFLWDVPLFNPLGLGVVFYTESNE